MRKLRLLFIIVIINHSLPAQTSLDNTKIDGYRGIWFTLGQFSEYGDKYSGGLGTYTAKHRPLAICAPEVKKTFFVYGGTSGENTKHLLCMIGYYDHKKNKISMPTVVYDKQGVDDPHDNPSLSIDSQGYLWVFVSGRGKSRPGYKYRSDTPWNIDSFSRITEEEMTYPQPIWDDSLGFFHFFTKYTGIRELYFETSKDGITWTDDTKLAGIVEPGATKSGHYQVSGKYGQKIATFFNRHPDGNVDKRTDLYYLQTMDFGRNWTTVDGQPLSIPLTQVDCGGRVIDYAADGKNVYVKDIGFDSDGDPVCLYVTSQGHEPGPVNGPRQWVITRYKGTAWISRIICESDHNYDMGSLYINGNTWQVTAPTDIGPQPYQTGGEIVIWKSNDNGESWAREKTVTKNSLRNNSYVRMPVNANDPFFYFWADGDPMQFSKSSLYFTDSKGKRVYQLPYSMTKKSMKPIPIRNR
ncbi:MAG: BNR-4 repeat-containing protein [Cyclobacteriaceae bacterium]|nr:BNR-4 repeat-containing protein [Cyclobacteriaceae bacterium]